MSDHTSGLAQAIERVVALGGLDASAMVSTSVRLDSLTKPPGSLGRLESLAIQLAGITGDLTRTYSRRAIVVAAADHGVVRQGVSAYPADVTPQMVANFLAGGAAINVLAARVGATVSVVDAGVAGAIPAVGAGAATLIRVPIRAGTDDMTAGPAMSHDEALRAIGIGLDVVAALEHDGVELIGIGEMGIGNTTAASAITAAITGADPDAVTGRGTGLDATARAHKVAVVRRGLEVNRPAADDGLDVLAKIGGFEIAGLAGVILAGASRRVPVALDGFIAGAAALIAVALAPAARHALLASHRSAEPGHAVALAHLGLAPYLDLDLRLGEGTGAALFVHLARAAAAIYGEMATFKSAGVDGPV